MTWTTRAMSSRHEDFLATLFQGRRTRNSGAGWSDQMDGKQSHGFGEYVLSWDGKATLGKSIGVSKAMWDKAVFQTQGWEIPIIPLRFYSNERLTNVDYDLVVIDARVLAAMQADANEVVVLRERLARLEVDSLMHTEEVLEINDDQTVRLVTRQVSGIPRYHVQATGVDDGYWYGSDPPLYTPMFTDEQEARDAYAKRCILRKQP